MGVTSWTYDSDTAYVNMTSPTEIIANSSTFDLVMPAVSLKANGPYLESSYKFKWQLNSVSVFNGATSVLSSLNAATSTWVSKNTYAAATWNTPTTSKNTSSLFSSSNPTVRTVALDIKTSAYGELMAIDNHQGAESILTNGVKTLGAINVTLDVPPEATVSAMTYDKAFIYAGLTTASVTISSAAAYYGGSVTDVTLSIGAQSASISGNGTISILLDTAGTFTPTVKVTDSRGQTKTYTLSPITVNTYTAPTISFTAERTDSAGKPDEEGTYATCPSMFIFADAIANLIAPSVVLTDENGTQTTPTISWYTTRAADGTLSGVISDWSSVSAGDTVYGLVPGLNTNYSYQISIRPRDSQGTGTAITQTVASAFYTIDFLAGGHGIAFGQPSSQAGFECNMPTTFHDTVTIEDDADFGADIFIELPNYQTSGVDKDIYDAVVALGWDSEVLS